MKGKGRILFSVLLLIMLCGCGAVREEIGSSDLHIKTHFTEHVVRDSIIVYDSIFVREKTDTVYFTKYRTLYKHNVVHDTVFVCDTLYKEKVVTRSVENGAHCNLKWLCLYVLILVLCFIVIKWLLKKVLK